MQISINNIPSESLINTVCLYRNQQSPTNVYLFRCYKCGTPINQIQGLISSINAGFFPSDDVTTISHCYKCAEKYTFLTFPQSKATTIGLVLSANKLVTTFHCIICRLQLLQYGAKGAVLLPDFKPVSLQESFPCFGPVCKMSYRLSDIVEADIMI